MIKKCPVCKAKHRTQKGAQECFMNVSFPHNYFVISGQEEPDVVKKEYKEMIEYFDGLKS